MRLPKLSAKKIALYAVLLLIAGILIWAGILTYRVVDLSNNARTLMASLQSDTIDFQTLKPTITKSVDDLRSIQASLKPVYPLFTLGSKLPLIGGTLGDIPPLLDFSAGLSDAGSMLINAFEPALATSGAAASGQSSTERIFTAIQAGQPALENAQQKIDQVAPLRSNIQAEYLPGSIQKYYQKLDALFPVLQRGIPALKQLPGLMGGQGKINYLVLAQNRDELRATGGFITGIGLAAFEQGKLVSFQIGDSYAVDDFSKGYPVPPLPLKQFMAADYWVTRDANWSPDFPTAAVQAQKLYTLSTGINTQGVIAFDQLALTGILQVIGPVTIANYPDAISAANVENFMRLSWAPSPDQGVTPAWWPNRKNFMGELGKVILAKLFSAGDPKLLGKLGLTVISLIKSGHLLVYVDQPEIKTLLAQAGLDGSLPSPTGDLLYLVDSNVGFNKTDSVVNRDLSYSIDLSNPQAPLAQITVHYVHTISQNVICKQEASYGDFTYANMQARCYWDYWRIYLPSGTLPVSSSVPPVPGAMLLSGKDWNGPVTLSSGENDLAVAAGLMVLPTNTQQQFSLSVALPASILTRVDQNTWTYQLTILKQPGLANLPVSVEVKLPASGVVDSVPGGWQKAGSSTWQWKGTLTEAFQAALTFSVTK